VPLLDRYREHDIDLVMGTLRADAADLEDALGRALRLGAGSVAILTEGDERFYSERLFCPACGIGFPPLDPQSFSFNSRQGAAASNGGRGAGGAGGGAGRRTEPAPESVREATRTLERGALLPFERPELAAEKRRLLRFLTGERVPLDRPVGRLGARQRRLILE